MKGLEFGLLIGSLVALANYLIMVVIFPIHKIRNNYHPIIGVIGFLFWGLPMYICVWHLNGFFRYLPDMKWNSLNDYLYRFSLLIFWGYQRFGLVSVIKLAIEEDKEN